MQHSQTVVEQCKAMGFRNIYELVYTIFLDDMLMQYANNENYALFPMIDSGLSKNNSESLQLPEFGASAKLNSTSRMWLTTALKSYGYTDACLYRFNMLEPAFVDSEDSIAVQFADYLANVYGKKLKREYYSINGKDGLTDEFDKLLSSGVVLVSGLWTIVKSSDNGYNFQKIY